MTPEEVAQAQAGDQALRQELAMRHWSLVELLARKQAARSQYLIEAGDFWAAGYEALLWSLDRFDPSRGINFRTYAQRRVEGAMLDVFRQQDCSRSARRRCNQLSQSHQAIAHEQGRRVSLAEAAEHAGLTEQQARQAIASNQLHKADPLGISDPLTGKPIHDVIADPRQPDPSQRMVTADFWRSICRGLTQRSRLMLIAYWREGETMKAIAETHGLSESRVSQMLSQLHEQLRHSLSVERPRPKPRPQPQPAPRLPQPTPRRQVMTTANALDRIRHLDQQFGVMVQTYLTDRSRILQELAGVSPASEVANTDSAAVTPQRKPRPGTKTRRIWDLLADKGPQKTKQISKELAITPGSVAGLLIQSGYFEKAGDQYGAPYGIKRS